MDNIKTSVSALSNANVSKHEAAIKKQFDGIDADFQNVLSEYLEDLLSFKNSVVEFEVENSKAIRDRMTRIAEYSATVYKPRNIK